MPDPGIEDIVADELNHVRNAIMDVENGVSQDDHEDGWNEALFAAADLAEATEDLRERLRKEIAKRGID